MSIDASHKYENFISRAIGSKDRQKYNDPGLMAGSEEFELAKGDKNKFNDVKATIAYSLVAIKNKINKENDFFDEMIKTALKSIQLDELIQIILKVNEKVKF